MKTFDQYVKENHGVEVQAVLEGIGKKIVDAQAERNLRKTRRNQQGVDAMQKLWDKERAAAAPQDDRPKPEPGSEDDLAGKYNDMRRGVQGLD